MLRAVVLPVVAVAFDLLTAAATFGILTLLYSGEDALLSGPGFIDPISIIGIFAFIFGVSMVYEVVFLHRTREAFLETGDARAAVRTGLARTAAAATGAAAVMVAAIIPFAAVGDVPEKSAEEEPVLHAHRRRDGELDRELASGPMNRRQLQTLVDDRRGARLVEAAQPVDVRVTEGDGNDGLFELPAEDFFARPAECPFRLGVPRHDPAGRINPDVDIVRGVDDDDVALGANQSLGPRETLVAHRGRGGDTQAPRLVLGRGFLDRLRSAFHQVLRLFQAEPRDGPDLLDDVDLLVARRRQDDGELGLPLHRCGGSGGASDRRGGNGHRRGGGDAPLLFEQLGQGSSFQHREAGQQPRQLVERGVDHRRDGGGRLLVVADGRPRDGQVTGA